MAYHIFAVIKAGSLEQELGIYELGAKREFRRIEKVVKLLPLGRETFECGKITYGTLESLIKVLEDFSEIMKAYRVNSYKAYATSAFREAENAKIITDRIRVRTGINLDIVSNSEERFINYKALAVRDDMNFSEIIKDGTAIIDSGYGSMQLSLFDKDKLISTENLPLASVNIAETVNEIPVGRALMLEEIEEITDTELMSYRRLYLKNKSSIQNLIGLGEGAGYLFERKPEARERAAVFSAEEVMEHCCGILSMSSEKIEDKYSVSRSFADVITVTAVIYKRIMEMYGAKRLILPGSGFCDGAAAEYAEKNKLIKLKHDFEADIVAASANIAKKYKCDTEHSKLVEEYALKIFDSIKKLAGFSKRDRLILRIAAMLHSCGKFINIRNCADCGYNIIISTEIIGLSHNERAVAANVVRYNSKDFDYGISEDNAELIRIAKLTAVLRIANALDRGHRGKLKDLKVTVNERERRLVISAYAGADTGLEKLEIEKKSGFFEEIFGYKPVFRQKKLLS